MLIMGCVFRRSSDGS